MAYLCDNDQNPSVMAISNLETGAVFAPCADCLIPTFLGALQAMVPETHTVELVTADELAVILANRPEETDDQVPTGPEQAPTDTTEPEPADSGSGDPTPPEVVPSATEEGPGGFAEDTVERALADTPDPTPAPS